MKIMKICIINSTQYYLKRTCSKNIASNVQTFNWLITSKINYRSATLIQKCHSVLKQEPISQKITINLNKFENLIKVQLGNKNI